jgi:hypothetical protein
MLRDAPLPPAPIAAPDGRWRARKEVPDAPPSFAKYAVSEDGDAADLERKPVRKYAVERIAKFKKKAK